MTQQTGPGFFFVKELGVNDNFLTTSVRRIPDGKKILIPFPSGNLPIQTKNDQIWVAVGMSKSIEGGIKDWSEIWADNADGSDNGTEDSSVNIAEVLANWPNVNWVSFKGTFRSDFSLREYDGDDKRFSIMYASKPPEPDDMFK